MRQVHLALRVGSTSLTMGASWLVALPLTLWLIATVYVPSAAPTLSATVAWLIAGAATLALLGSLALHVLSHVWAAQLAGRNPPATIPVYAFGDAAQVWPATCAPWREVVVAMAGPMVNALLALTAYLVWDRQLNEQLNVTAILLAAANAGFALVNLAPGFPLDGGRLIRAIAWGVLGRPALSTRLGLWVGRLILAALAGWGVILIAQRARFSLENGAGTLLVTGVLGLALREQPAWDWNGTPLPRPSPNPVSVARGLLAGLLIVGLLGITFSLVPTNLGLEAPGVALAVEPMIEVPAEYRHAPAGSFILTTVIPQTPITAGQWAYAQLNPVVKIVPPERIVPPDTTIQEQAQRGSRMLEESETLAKVVGLRLAGFDVKIVGQAVEVTSILPESPANGILQPGDLISRLDGEAVRTAEQLAERVRAQKPDATVSLVVERDGRRLELSLPLMKPAAGEPPRIGIAVQTVGTDVELPFPVEVRPQKIAGGPSAGLMFTLTIYNLVTPEDLTRGLRIAGTGTINLDGQVGPIGGVEQKVAAAEAAGAAYFLVPPANYEDAQRVARKIIVVQVATAEEAIAFLRDL